jgi:hypothetical protein
VRFCIILSALCILVSFATGQVDTAWMRLYDGPDNLRDAARAIALDDSGNVYVTGQSYVTGVRTRIATLKYSGDGALRWAAFYDRQANFTTSGARVAVGPAGAIYVAGTTTGSGTQSDITTVKYSPLGDTVWARFLDGPAHSNDEAIGLGLDAAGNIYSVGRVSDPSTSSDFAVAKYDAAGNEQWVSYFRGGTRADVSVAAATDSAGSVSVVGTSEGPDSTSRIATVRFSPAGDTLWARFYQHAPRSIEAASGVAVDAAGNVFTAGSDVDAATGYDFVVIKYSAGGVEQWVRRYDAASGMDLASSVAVDGAGAVYVAGQCEDSAGTAVCTAVKYDADGSLRWVRGYRSGDFTGARAVVLDERANVYVGGFCQLTDTTEVPLLVKYDSAGNEQWAIQHAPIPTGVGEVNKLAVDDSAYVYGAGWYGAGIMSTDFLTAKYGQASGIVEGATPGASFASSSPTIVRGVLFWGAYGTRHTAYGTDLLDISGRKVMELQSGPNDVSRLAAGVYFVRAVSRKLSAVSCHKVVIQR